MGVHNNFAKKLKLVGISITHEYAWNLDQIQIGFGNPVSHSRKGSREEEGCAYLVGARRRRRAVEGTYESLGTWSRAAATVAKLSPRERGRAGVGLNGSKESRGQAGKAGEFSCPGRSLFSSRPDSLRLFRRVWKH